MRAWPLAWTLAGTVFVLSGTLVPEAPVAANPHTVVDADPAGSDNDVVREYCVRCHNDRRLRGNLSLESFDALAPHLQGDVAEKMIVKLRAGMMPPPGVSRPSGDTLDALVAGLEARIDAVAAANPAPGGRPFQRLNQAEYAASIRDLLGVEIDAASLLPPDTKSANFDNIADVQALSPTLLEAYLNAAADISRMAVGDRNAPAINVTYRNS